MSDATTIPGSPAVVAPRRTSAAMIVAATLAFVSAFLTAGGLFPDYWDPPPFALLDETGLLAQTTAFALAVLVAGVLLLGARSAPIGAATLLIVVVMGAQPRVADAAQISNSNGPKAGTGFALVSAGFVLALASAVIGALVNLRPREWGLRGGARFLGVLAVLAGFGAAVGYGMNPFETARGVGVGTPLEPIPRQLWAALLVVVVLSIFPAVTVAVGGRLGTGLALGLLFGIGGIAALRVGTIFGTVDGRDVGISGAEGTWTFLAAGGAALIMTFAGLAAGAGAGARRAVPEPVVATVSSADEPTEPVIAGDEPDAIVEAPEPAGSDPEPTQTRTDPMPSARTSASASDADE